MLDLAGIRHVTRRFHSSRAEQENSLQEQRRADFGHSKCTTRFLQQRHHVADSILDFVVVRGKRRHWPGDPRTLETYLLDELPEANEDGVLLDFAGRDDGAMPKQECKIEIPSGSAGLPFGNGLAGHTGTLRSLGQRDPSVHGS